MRGIYLHRAQAPATLSEDGKQYAQLNDGQGMPAWLAKSRGVTYVGI